MIGKTGPNRGSLICMILLAIVALGGTAQAFADGPEGSSPQGKSVGETSGSPPSPDVSESLYYGALLTSPAAGFITTAATLESVTASPSSTAEGSLCPSFLHQVGLMDHRYEVRIPALGAHALGKIKLTDDARDRLSEWVAVEGLQPKEVPFSCTTDPVDDYWAEDDETGSSTPDRDTERNSGG